MLEMLMRMLNEAFALPDGESNTDSGMTDGSQNTDGTDGQTDGSQNTGKVEFTPEQQKHINDVITANVMRRGVQRGEEALLKELGITREDLPTIKEALSQQDTGDSDDADNETDSRFNDGQQNTGTKPKTKAEQQIATLQAELIKMQQRFETRETALQDIIEKERGISQQNAVDAALSLALADIRFAPGVDRDELKTMLATHVKTDDNRVPIVVDADGNSQIDPTTGGDLTVQAFVKTWIEQRPYYLAAGSGGAGSSSVNGGGPPSPLKSAILSGDAAQVAQVLEGDPEALKALTATLTNPTDVNPFKALQQQRAQQ